MVLALRHLYSTWGSSGHIQRAASEDLRRPQAAFFPRTVPVVILGHAERSQKKKKTTFF